MIEKGLRAQPFTDTILREMAINFPQGKSYFKAALSPYQQPPDASELLEIPGIDPERVRLYGKPFLTLIRTSHNAYERMMQKEEDCPCDPNHQNVIDISSDEDYGDDADLDELGNDGSQEERSQYFPGPDVEAFNARCT